MFAHLLTQTGGASLFPQLNPVPAAPPLNPQQHRSAPPSPVKRHGVSVDQFIQLYNLEDSDAVLLKEVGFRPGDPTTAALDNELKAIGFTFFSWRRIHHANIRFKADLASGTYD